MIFSLGAITIKNEWGPQVENLSFSESGIIIQARSHMPEFVR